MNDQQLQPPQPLTGKKVLSERTTLICIALSLTFVAAFPQMIRSLMILNLAGSLGTCAGTTVVTLILSAVIYGGCFFTTKRMAWHKAFARASLVCVWLCWHTRY